MPNIIKTSSEIRNPEDVPEYAVQALIEEWESMMGNKVLQGMVCVFEDYFKLLKQYNLKGLPHIHMNREMLERRGAKKLLSCERPYNQIIKEKCLVNWPTEDENYYTIFVIQPQNEKDSKGLIHQGNHNPNAI